jgi:ribonuclease E
MPKRMLIDASHPEETRVVVLDGQKVEEFDFEAASKRPLKGNIYLAKVTRVEPSLQAAFVEYGGNRQGFLAFSEIHPDYYQIPVADRQALLAEQEAEARRRSDDEVESFDISPGPKPESGAEEEETAEDASASDAPADTDTHADDHEDHTEASGEGDEPHHEPNGDEGHGFAEGESEFVHVAEEESEQGVVDQQAAGEAAVEEDGEGDQPAQAQQAQRPSQRWMRRRHYKIQEVIKRRQIILVQVVKEERGNKGAALTTYLSLAGRYCVLMPNTPRGGGISRKITNANDRKRLKSAAQALELPEGMGLIIRTAGENRTKVEIKRDYEYLLRMWDQIREKTLESIAPACVYEEGDLVKRAIRDLYNKDVGEILVEGDDGYRNAKDFMRMLMPSHAKNVKQYREPVPLFQRHHIEAQLDAMFSPTVTLKSGGYIVINQTEALVSIDVNSGRATREHSIEETARKTNLEAADEVGRQLRLRDLAGLIVIDFIDMEDGRNDRDVEKRMRDAVKNDRARVQIGKISQFGLLEMSRQRLRAGVIAGSTVPCPHCGGQGIVRSVESTALRVLRGLEDEGQKLKASAVVVRVASDVAIYTLNQKRREIQRIEGDYGMDIEFEPKEGLMVGSFEIERTTQKTAEEQAQYARPADTLPVIEAEEIEEAVEAEEVEETLDTEEGAQAQPQNGAQQPSAPGSSSKRRRRRRGGRGRSGSSTGNGNGNGEHVSQPQHHGREPQQAAPASPSLDAPVADAAVEGQPVAEPGQPQSGDPNAPRRKRRRRRGGRGRGGSSSQNGQPGGNTAELHGDELSDEIDTTPQPHEPAAARPTRPEEPALQEEIVTPNGSSTPVWTFANEDRAAAPATISEPIRKPAPEPVAEREPEPVAAEPAPPAAPQGPLKKGWWQRTFRSDG